MVGKGGPWGARNGAHEASRKAYRAGRTAPRLKHRPRAPGPATLDRAVRCGKAGGMIPRFLVALLLLPLLLAQAAGAGVAQPSGGGQGVISGSDMTDRQKAKLVTLWGGVAGFIAGGVVQNRSVNATDGCLTCRPDIMVYDENNRTLHVIEIKTGDADFTPNQRQIYPEIADGSASMNASQLRELGLDVIYAGRPLSDIPSLNIVVEVVWR
jgi:hypothetical protein